MSDLGFMGYCIFGTSSVEVKENADIQCSIGSNGDIMVKEYATITGNIVSGGDVELKDGVTVVGNVTAAGTVTYSGETIIGGIVLEGATLTPVAGPLPSYTVDITITDAEGNVTTETVDVDGAALPSTFPLTAGGPDITTEVGETYELTPGSYGRVEVKEDGFLTLTSGHYAFDQLIIKEDTNIYLYLDDGPIILDVVDYLEFKENIVMAVTSGTGDASDFVVRLGDQALFKEGGQYLGTYFGFGATLAQMEVKENAILRGGLYGDDVMVKENALVIGMPSLEAYLALFGL